jgi:hypothetical protein
MRGRIDHEVASAGARKVEVQKQVVEGRKMVQKHQLQDGDW